MVITLDTDYNSKREKIELKEDAGYYYLYVNGSCVAHSRDKKLILDKYDQYKRV